MIVYLYYLIIVIAEAFAQSIIEYVHHNKNYYLLLIALVFYAILALFLLVAYRYKSIGITNSICGGMGIIVMILISRFIFNDKITLHDYIGILLILMGILLIEYKKNKN